MSKSVERRLALMRPKSRKLLPCPHCGGRACYEPISTFGEVTYYVVCVGLRGAITPCRAMSPYHAPKKEIREWWNRRAK